MESKDINRCRHQSKKAEIVSIKELTEMEKLFEIRLKTEDFLEHDPGQFVEVSLFGVGEAPISICSSPTKWDVFELCVRKAGKFTTAFHKLKEGDEVGVRGPFGVGFPVHLLEGNDLLLVAGGLGIAPLRSLINYVLDNRREFGKVDILMGTRDPSALLFGNETEEWLKRIDVNFTSTVDAADPNWKGNVGMITSLIPGVDIDPSKTFSVVVGPPVMYKFVIDALLKKGIPENQIFLSLERQMKCGLGTCGHCQIHDIYCCQEGPVFSYQRIKDVEGAI